VIDPAPKPKIYGSQYDSTNYEYVLGIEKPRSPAPAILGPNVVTREANIEKPRSPAPSILGPNVVTREANIEKPRSPAPSIIETDVVVSSK
jgi:hypothetical protein